MPQSALQMAEESSNLGPGRPRSLVALQWASSRQCIVTQPPTGVHSAEPRETPSQRACIIACSASMFMPGIPGMPMPGKPPGMPGKPPAPLLSPADIVGTRGSC